MELMTWSAGSVSRAPTSVRAALRGACARPVAARDDGRHRVGTAVGVVHRGDLGLQHDVAARSGHLVRARLPHQPRPRLRVLELLDQAGDVLLVAARQERVDDRGGQVQVLDALRRPVGLDVGGRAPPQLLGVGLEEDAVEPPAEARGRPPLERRLVLGRAHPHPGVGQDAEDRLDEPEVAQGVHGAQRVVEQLPVVVDPAHPRAQDELVLGEDLVPQRLDLGHLGEEAVPADVEPPAVALRGAGDAAHHRVALQHRGGDPGLHQLVGGRQARRTGADDHDGSRALDGHPRAGVGGRDLGRGAHTGPLGDRGWPPG